MGRYADMLEDSPSDYLAAPPNGKYTDLLLDRPQARQQDPNDPIQKFMGTGSRFVADEPSEAAGAGRQAVGSLPTEMTARVRYFATRRFPNMSEQEAVSRYGMRDGRLFYVDDQGMGHFEESKARWPESLSDVGQAAASTAKSMAGSTGPAIPVITGTAAGVATAPVAGGVPGAAAGGAAGDVSRQFLASAFTGEEKPFTNRLAQTGGAALQEGAGQLLGVAGGKVLNRLGRTPTYDLPASSEVVEAARRFDIPLTAGEHTGSRTLIRRQKILANTTEGEEVFEEFYNFRNDKVRDAVYGVLEKISPETSVRGATKLGVEGARTTVDVERQALAKQARPLYEKAYEVDTVETAPVIDSINKKLSTASAPVRAKLLRVRRDLLRGEGDEAVSENRLAKLDDIKKWLDDEIKAAGRGDKALGKGQKFHLEDIRKVLLHQADEADKAVTGGAYRQARNIYTEGLPASTELTKGVVGDVARLEANDVLRASRVVFSPRTSSQQDVALARDAFEKAGKTEEWNALVRAHLQDTFEEIPESAFGSVTNLGGTFFKKVIGSPKKAGMLEEALKNMPATNQDVIWLFQALQATGKAAKGESITAFAQAGQAQLAREAKPLGATAIESLEIWRSPSRIARWWADVAEGRYAAKMSRLLTTEDGYAKLKELRQLSPASAGAVIGLGHLLTAFGASESSDLVGPRDVNVGGFAQSSPTAAPPAP